MAASGQTPGPGSLTSSPLCPKELPMSGYRQLFVLVTLVAAASLTLSAQAKRSGLMGDLIADVTDVEGKIVGLARARR